jgi:hypothetical protein
LVIAFFPCAACFQPHFLFWRIAFRDCHVLSGFVPDPKARKAYDPSSGIAPGPAGTVLGCRRWQQRHLEVRPER